jgi:polyribonucleotide nucleotidyltransferase
MAPYKELRNNHANVFVDLSKDSKMMKLRGKMEAITAVKDDILKINVTMETVAVTGREAGLVIGKGGATIKALTEKFDVGLDVKDSKDDTAIIDIVGISINVAAAVKEINDMIFQNQDVDTNIFCSKLFKNKCLEKAGAMIKELQKEINAALDCNGVRIQFEGRDRGEGEMESSGALLEIRSSRTHHASAVELVKKRVAEYEAKTLVIKFESHVIPAIIGKGGEKINELKKLGKGATIELDRVIGEVSVLATDETTKNLVKDAIEEIIAQNQVLKVPVEDSMMGLVSISIRCFGIVLFLLSLADFDLTSFTCFRCLDLMEKNSGRRSHRRMFPLIMKVLMQLF